MRRISGYLIAAAIIAITIILILQIRKPVNAELVPVGMESIGEGREEWAGIFIQGERIGYSFTKISRADTGLTVENITRMTIVMMNQTRTLTTHIFARTDADYTLKDYSLELRNGGLQRVEGQVTGKKLKFTSHVQGKQYTQTIDLKEKPYFPDAIEEVIKSKNLKAGDEITIPYFDPTTQSSSTARITMQGEEEVTVLGKTQTGTRVELTFMGISSILWLDKEFKLIKESSPAMGLEIIPLSKEQALAEITPDKAFDLITFFSVKLDPPTPDPTSLTYLKIQMNDITPEGLDLADDFQELVSRQPIVVASTLPRLSSLPELTLPIEHNRTFLAPSAYIQCADPLIIEKAKEMIADENNAVEATAKLVNGVYRFLEKNPTASLPSALEVLQTRKGDCNEHAILFTALARAVGLPTKIYVGLVNLNGYAYYYHAWCAVWLGKWVPVDPTFNQFPADVGHLKLKEGEIAEQAMVLKVVGKLKIQTLEYTE
ncbi:MAG: transglutaminase domain-containing protein [candidate division WOR-3 bacterium]|nr:MAG: transglutaminase domain-containing protein [candidate division WOR-3 bacterium]